MHHPPIPRSLRRYLLLLVCTIALGLASRRYAALLPAVVARYAGDVLWASMVFWWGALIFRRQPTLHIAGSAMLVSALVELSQLYRAPWLNALRDTRAGALVLGQGFLWSDLLCYALGVLIAAAIDSRWRDSLPPAARPD